MEERTATRTRPYVGVRFECCRLYSRIYREADVLVYRGRCPKCYREVLVRVDPYNGKPSKFLIAY
jgi:hypothetical protein